MVQFESKTTILLQCDVSKSGLGCCLFQEYQNNTMKLVAYASHTMNDHKINYRLKKTIYFGCQKIHNFLYHAKVDVENEHIPVKSIIMNEK